MRLKYLQNKKQSIKIEVYMARTGAKTNEGALSGFDYYGEWEGALGDVMTSPGLMMMEPLAHKEAGKQAEAKGWMMLTGILVTDEVVKAGDVNLQFGVKAVEKITTFSKPDIYLIFNKRELGDNWSPVWTTEPRRGVTECTFGLQRVPVWTIIGDDVSKENLKICLVQWSDAVSDKLKILGEHITSLTTLTSAVASGASMKLLKPDGKGKVAGELIVMSCTFTPSAFAGKKKGGEDDGRESISPLNDVPDAGSSTADEGVASVSTTVDVGDGGKAGETVKLTSGGSSGKPPPSSKPGGKPGGKPPPSSKPSVGATAAVTTATDLSPSSETAPIPEVSTTDSTAASGNKSGKPPPSSKPGGKPGGGKPPPSSKPSTSATENIVLTTETLSSTSSAVVVAAYDPTPTASELSPIPVVESSPAPSSPASIKPGGVKPTGSKPGGPKPSSSSSVMSSSGMSSGYTSSEASTPPNEAAVKSAKPSDVGSATLASQSTLSAQIPAQDIPYVVSTPTPVQPSATTAPATSSSKPGAAKPIGMKPVGSKPGGSKPSGSSASATDTSAYTSSAYTSSAESGTSTPETSTPPPEKVSVPAATNMSSTANVPPSPSRVTPTAPVTASTPTPSAPATKPAGKPLVGKPPAGLKPSSKPGSVTSNTGSGYTTTGSGYTTGTESDGTSPEASKSSLSDLAAIKQAETAVAIAKAIEEEAKRAAEEAAAHTASIKAQDEAVALIPAAAVVLPAISTTKAATNVEVQVNTVSQQNVPTSSSVSSSVSTPTTEIVPAVTAAPIDMSAGVLQNEEAIAAEKKRLDDEVTKNRAAEETENSAIDAAAKAEKESIDASTSAALQEKAEKEAKEKELLEKAEKEAKEKAEKESKEKAEKGKASGTTSPQQYTGKSPPSTTGSVTSKWQPKAASSTAGSSPTASTGTSTVSTPKPASSSTFGAGKSSPSASVGGFQGLKTASTGSSSSKPGSVGSLSPAAATGSTAALPEWKRKLQEKQAKEAAEKAAKEGKTIPGVTVGGTESSSSNLIPPSTSGESQKEEKTGVAEIQQKVETTILLQTETQTPIVASTPAAATTDTETPLQASTVIALSVPVVTVPSETPGTVVETATKSLSLPLIEKASEPSLIPLAPLTPIHKPISSGIIDASLGGNVPLILSPVSTSTPSTPIKPESLISTSSSAPISAISLLTDPVTTTSPQLYGTLSPATKDALNDAISRSSIANETGLLNSVISSISASQQGLPTGASPVQSPRASLPSFISPVSSPANIASAAAASAAAEERLRIALKEAQELAARDALRANPLPAGPPKYLDLGVDASLSTFLGSPPSGRGIKQKITGINISNKQGTSITDDQSITSSTQSAMEAEAAAVAMRIVQQMLLQQRALLPATSNAAVEANSQALNSAAVAAYYAQLGITPPSLLRGTTSLATGPLPSSFFSVPTKTQSASGSVPVSSSSSSLPVTSNTPLSSTAGEHEHFVAFATASKGERETVARSMLSMLNREAELANQAAAEAANQSADLADSIALREWERGLTGLQDVAKELASSTPAMLQPSRLDVPFTAEIVAERMQQRASAKTQRKVKARVSNQKNRTLKQKESNRSTSKERSTFLFNDVSNDTLLTQEDLLLEGEDEDIDADESIDEDAKEIETPLPPPEDPRIVEQKKRLHDLRVSSAAAELGIPAAQVLYSVLRASLTSKRQDLGQLRYLLSIALKEVSAVEYDVALAKGSALGVSSSISQRGKICENMPTDTMQVYARQAQALKAEVTSPIEAENSVGIPALKDHMEKHGPLADKAARDATTEIVQALTKELSELQLLYRQLEADLGDKQAEAESVEARKVEMQTHLFASLRAAQESREKQDTEVFTLAAAIARADGKRLLSPNKDTSQTTGVSTQATLLLSKDNVVEKEKKRDESVTALPLSSTGRLAVEEAKAELLNRDQNWSGPTISLEELLATPLDESETARDRRLNAIIDTAKEETIAPIRAELEQNLSALRLHIEMTVLKVKKEGEEAIHKLESAWSEATSSISSSGSSGGISSPVTASRVGPLLAIDFMKERSEIRSRFDIASSKLLELTNAAQAEQSALRMSIAQKTEQIMRTKVSIANQREFYDLKVAVRRAWAMRSVKASAANIFLGDSLKNAPYCAALAHRLRDVFRAVSSGLLPPVIPLETQMWSDGMAVTPASVGVATSDSNALSDDVIAPILSRDRVEEKPATTIRGLLQRIAVSEETKADSTSSKTEEGFGDSDDLNEKERRKKAIGAINIRDRIRAAYNTASASSTTPSSESDSIHAPLSSSTQQQISVSTSNYDASKYTEIFHQANSRDLASITASAIKEKNSAISLSKPGTLSPSGDSVLMRSTSSTKQILNADDTDIEIGGKIPTRTIAQVQAEVKRERERARQAAEAALAAEKERIRRARLAARMQEAADVVAKERAEQLVEATRQRAVKLLNGETPSSTTRISSRIPVSPSPYQTWLAAEKNAKNVLLESQDEEAIEAAINRAKEKADLAEQSGVEMLTAPSSRATSPSGRLSDVHIGQSSTSTKVGILAAAAAAAASSKKRVESPPSLPPPQSTFSSGFKQTDLNQIISGSEDLRNQFFEALMSPPSVATAGKTMKTMPISSSVAESPQTPALLQQQLSLLKEKQANSIAIKAQEEAKRELEDARRAVAQAFDAASELGEFAPKPVILLTPQSPIPVGPVAAKVAEAFGAVPAANVIRKESRDLYGTPSSHYKFLDLPNKAHVDMSINSLGGNVLIGGVIGKMPPPPAGLYPVAIRLPSTNAATLVPQTVPVESIPPKPSATSVYGFSSQTVNISKQDTNEKEKTSKSPVSSGKLTAPSPPKNNAANISNSLHPMPTALPTVTWDTHVIRNDEYNIQSISLQQQYLKASNPGAVTHAGPTRQVLDELGDLSTFPNVYASPAIISSQQIHYLQQQHVPIPQSRLNLPSAVAMMGKSRPVSTLQSLPPTSTVSSSGSITSGYVASAGGSVTSNSDVSHLKKKNTPIPSLDAARNSPRFSFGSSALGYDLARDAYQSYDKEAQYKKKSSTPLPISFSAAAVAAGKKS
jgi:hypothetical protein